MKLFHHLLGLFESIDLVHEERNGLFSDSAGVIFVEMGETLSEVWCATGVNPNAFCLNGVVSVSDKNDTVETRPL